MREFLEVGGLTFMIGDNGVRQVEVEFSIDPSNDDIEPFFIKIDVPSTGDATADIGAAKKVLQQLSLRIAQALKVE